MVDEPLTIDCVVSQSPAGAKLYRRFEARQVEDVRGTDLVFERAITLEPIPVNGWVFEQELGTGEYWAFEIQTKNEHPHFN